MKKQNLLRRAIRSVWAVARQAGIEPPASAWPSTGIMSTNEAVRKAMVQAWLRGYAAGKKSGGAA